MELLELLELHEVAFVERSRGIEPTTMTQRFSIVSMVRLYAYRYLIDVSSTHLLCPMVSGYILRGLSYHIAADHHPAMLLA